MDRTRLFRRVALSMLLGILIGFGLSEVAFYFLGETARPPQEFTFVIPSGTAEQVAAGRNPPGLPENIQFVVGDRLFVRNEDRVDHQLGPLWIPSYSTAELYLGEAENLAYECSFRTNRSFDLDVREPLTLGTRLYGILFAGVPMGILISLYSAILPSRGRHGAD